MMTAQYGSDISTADNDDVMSSNSCTTVDFLLPLPRLSLRVFLCLFRITQKSSTNFDKKKLGGGRLGCATNNRFCVDQITIQIQEFLKEFVHLQGRGNSKNFAVNEFL